jgi:hypothetical protein
MIGLPINIRLDHSPKIGENLNRARVTVGLLPKRAKRERMPHEIPPAFRALNRSNRFIGK